jgi:hypothetical protein
MTYSASTASAGNEPGFVQVVPAPSNAHYYEILDRTGHRRAGLTVLLDSQQRVLRAELCYYERYHALEPVQEEIFDRAVEIVESNYLGNGLSSDLAVIDGTPMAQEIIRHNNPDPTYRPDRRVRIWPFVVGYTAVIAVLLLVGLLNRTLLRPTPATVALPGDGTPAVAQRAAPLAASAAAPAAGDAATTNTADPLQPNTNGLPPSVNADPTLTPWGCKCAFAPGLRSFVRSAPGPEAGDECSAFWKMAPPLSSSAARPGCLGDSDTIVWWYVETADGVTGWTPANTSQLTLLEPVG